MTEMLSDVQALAGDIGPRGTGTAGEEAAAEYTAGRLASLGLAVDRHTFRAVASQNAFPLATDGVALIAMILYAFAGAPGRWIGAGLAMTTAPLLAQAIRTSDSLLRPLLPKVTSRNVVARVPPRQEIRRRAVLLAHLDTNRCRLAWQSQAVRLLEPLTWVTLGVLAALGVLTLAGAFAGGPDWVTWALLLPSGYILGTIITLWQDDRMPYTPGAHDNAASVAVALDIGKRLTSQPLEHTEVWLAFTGAEETDHAGLYDLLRRHGSALADADFVGLEGLGSRELVYLTRQGICFHYAPDADLRSLAARVATEHPELGVRPAQMIGEDEVGTLRRTGYRAICLAGRAPLTGTLPRWHRPDDTVETVSAEFMSRASDLAMAMLEALDHEAPGAGKEAPCARS